MANQIQKAVTLGRLHKGPGVLVLANAWDVATARVVEEAGFPAVATTSSGIANSLGYPDGEHISRREMLEIVRRIVTAVRVPVTADMEAGYAESPDEMVMTTRELIDSGAVGLNLEDSTDNLSRLLDLELQLDKIRALRETATSAGVPLVLNARTDAYWIKAAADANRMAETVRRANAYRQAGADCIFVPGLREPAAITEFLEKSPGPLNVLAGPGAPSIRELENLGVRRVSLGGGPARAAFGLMRRLVRELQASGTYDILSDYAIPSPEMNAMMKR